MIGPVPAALTGSLGTGRDLLLLAAGFGAGVVNGVAGGGTLVSFPTLLAMGYPALTANVTNTVGIWPGYIGGVTGFRSEIGDQRSHLVEMAPLSLLGAVVGSVLLLTTPPSDFARLVPWLVLGASALFALQPVLARLLSRHEQARTRRALLVGGLFLTAVYGGYFGAGLGVMLLAVLGMTLPDTLARTSGLRMALSVLVNGVAALVFIVHGSIVWQAAAMLAIGSLFGGWAGALLARRLPATWLRVLIVAIGVATGVKLLVP
ncbi:MAG TPA: sulfite exporter TauE/SafE family protein [Acidimicrobiales bacterium]|nr:sulfite exporter TauE/SafE family protein [Acidimicrobiales bacterium]